LSSRRISLESKKACEILHQVLANLCARVCFEINSTERNPYLILAYSESPFFADRECDATGDYARDLPLQFPVRKTGLNCVPPSYNRGGFKYLTVFMPERDVPSEGPYYLGGSSIRAKELTEQKLSWYKQIGQKILGGIQHVKNRNSKKASVGITALWVNCTAFPSNPNGRAYTGYFDSSSSLLNRIWYAGAWTLQLSTIIPTEGGAIIDFNRNFDHNHAPPGGWFSNFTVAKGNVVTTDGAKRDRMVWPGDMTIAVPGIAMSTYDMLAIRNALDVIYDHQYSDGSMPYAGPPMGAFHEFSDTYHLHTLIGTYFYALYSGDLEWLRKRWPAYTKALGVSIGKVDETGLLHVSSNSDWNRWGMTGHNVEASAILFEVLGNGIKLASWIGKGQTTNGEKWSTTRERLRKGIYSLYCEQDGMFSDNIGRRGCKGQEKVLPQDGNGWVLLSKVFDDPAQASLVYNVSENLRARWIKIGAPAVEFPNVMSPFSSSFELLGHTAARNPDAAVELMELMWGYMLDGPGMTNSTLIEGYRTDGYVHYPAYPSIARNSHAHGWSAGPTSVLIQGILGIQLKSPLGKKWHIEPQLTKWLSYARGGFATKLGKFEVSVTLMRSLSTGRKVEALNVTVPQGTVGSVNWGGQAQYRTEDMDTTFGWYRFLDVKTKVEEDWQTWSVADVKDFVKDDSWVKPEVQERPEGVVDWDALEKGYLLAGKKFMAPLPEATRP
jgi:hypothetical protein